jgi:hypothetical protein
VRAAAAAALLALLACARGTDREVAAAVRAYDDALVLAYRTGDASRMTAVAAADEARRVQVLVDLKAAAQLVLEATLEELEVTRVEAGARAVAETRERWRYYDRHLRPGEPSGPTIVSEMTMRYDLVREGGRWKVSAVKTLSSGTR